MQETKEAERQQRELEEVEVERLTWEKERLEEEKWVEQQRAVALRGSERVAEQCWRCCRLRLAQVGHLLKSQSRPQRGCTGGQGSLFLRKIACGVSHGSRCVGGTQRDVHGVASYVDS